MSTSSTPLKVAIVGAGLGGLTAAIALRRQGHLVQASVILTSLSSTQVNVDECPQVFEASALNKEIGAAIGVPPNAMKVLETYGYDQKNLRSCEYRGVCEQHGTRRAAWLMSELRGGRWSRTAPRAVSRSAWCSGTRRRIMVS